MALKITDEEIPNVLDQMFSQHPDRRRNAQELVTYISQNFANAEFKITGDIKDLRAQIRGGENFFAISPAFAVTEYPEEKGFKTIPGGQACQLPLYEIQQKILYSYQNKQGRTRILDEGNNINKSSSTITRLKTTMNTILYGAPGTGKTFSVVDYAYAITNKTELTQSAENRAERKKDFDSKMGSQIRFLTFHQSFSYEEFVEGIRAETTEDGKINYFVKPGIFKEICKDAGDNLEENYVLIIDEINRGNISKIFGELITLIEESKRARNEEALSVTLPYSVDDEQFSVPNNLYIIGTMNTADRSLALMDTALRRRFNFIEMMPDPELLKDIEVEGVKIKEMLTTMNKRITVLYDREHTLGHAFFMSLTNESTIDDLANIFKTKIIPLLQEYFFDDWRKIRMVLGDDRKDKDVQFIHANPIDKNLFLPNDDNEIVAEDAVFYEFNPRSFAKADTYIGIYK